VGVAARDTNTTGLARTLKRLPHCGYVWIFPFLARGRIVLMTLCRLAQAASAYTARGVR
jgi:hypothetical protein